MTTPVDELRIAAAKLRTLAREATPAPWSQRWERQELQVHGPGQEYPYSVAEWTYAVATVEPQATEQRAECDTADADYITALDPGVGVALADWLDAEAAIWDAVETVTAEYGPHGLKVTTPLSTHEQALAVARAVNGSEQS